MEMVNDSSKVKMLSAYTVFACLMSVALISAPVSAYNGIQLSSGTVENFTLVDQNNSEYKLSYATEDIVIVSFFFTCGIVHETPKDDLNVFGFPHTMTFGLYKSFEKTNEKLLEAAEVNPELSAVAKQDLRDRL